MKITCQACQAKYTIADEKVAGKIVKIRCKKCSATIVVNGNDPSAASVASSGGQAFDYASQGAAGEQWTVNVADGDQRTMTRDELIGSYHGGVVTDETYVWKDGMGDWLPVREIDDLYAACTATRAMAGPGAEADEGVTRVQDTGGAMFGGGAPASGPAGFSVPRPAAGAPAAENGGQAYSSPAAAVVARRPGARAPATDLFSGAAQAGDEDDVMTSAPAGMPQVHPSDGQMTGARNENSVLFSLSALTNKAGPPEKPSVGEASGLIDIRQLGTHRVSNEDAKKKSRIDDIMNLAGGGAFSPALAAPVFSAPPIEEYAPPADAAAMAMVPPSRGKGFIFAALGGGILLVGAAIFAAVFFMRKPAVTADSDKGATSAAATSSAPADTGSVAANAPTPTDTGSAGAPAPPASDTSPASTTTKTTKTTTTSTAAATTPTSTATATVAANTATATAAATAPAGGSDQPFNMGEAKAKLGAIASGVQSCKRGDTTGSGRVVVTFAPSGGAQSAVVQGPPFEGTPTGSCVAGRFRGARVPPFSGSPFSVSKSFSIN